MSVYIKKIFYCESCNYREHINNNEDNYEYCPVCGEPSKNIVKTNEYNNKRKWIA